MIGASLNGWVFWREYHGTQSNSDGSHEATEDLEGHTRPTAARSCAGLETALSQALECSKGPWYRNSILLFYRIYDRWCHPRICVFLFDFQIV